jgi:hypothetical protein
MYIEKKFTLRSTFELPLPPKKLKAKIKSGTVRLETSVPNRMTLSSNQSQDITGTKKFQGEMYFGKKSHFEELLSF